MSEEAVRQTRSQKRALEDCVPEDSKRLKRDEEEELRKAGAITGGGELRKAGAITGGGELRKAGAITGGGELRKAGAITGGGELRKAGAITGGGELPRAGAITGGGELRKAGAITGGGELPRAAGERNTAMSPSPDDVIVVSDEDPSPRVTGSRCRELDTALLMMSSTEERECVINQLKEELRLEEAKLILLKKIRHSQTHTDSSGQKVISVSAVLPPLLKSSTTAKTVVPARPSGTLAPPALVRGGHVTKHTQPLSVTPQQNSSSVLLAPRATGTSAQTHRILQSGLIRMTSTPSASLLLLNQAAGSSAGECVSSVQASVKLALRRQLEKSLLDIPPAKPLPSQFSFMPSAASHQFLCLLGLEEVVQNLLESLGRGQQGVYAGLVVSAEPSCCRQCETDFTRRWSEDGGGAILCERCLSANQKQALKTQHTNRLKAAFVKALQQEQEIEQRFLKTTASSSSSSSAHRGKMSRPPAASKQVSPRVLQASGIRSISSSSSSSSRLQSAVVHRAAQLAVRQGSEVIRSRDPATSGWRKRSRGAAGVTKAYMNPSLSGHKSSSALERHREFLLDMIPSHTVSHTTHSWK